MVNWLNYYGYHEDVDFVPMSPCASDYEVKISKDDKVIEIKEDGSLKASIQLAYSGETGTLYLIGKDGKPFADVQLPITIKSIELGGYNPDTQTITLIVTATDGEVVEFELDVKELVYFAGNGINISEENEISIKLNDTETNNLTLDEDGLGIDLSDYATVSAITALEEKHDEEFEGLTTSINEVASAVTYLGIVLSEEISARTECDAELEERINALDDDLASLSGEVASFSALNESIISELSALTDNISDLTDSISAITEEIDVINENVDSLSGQVQTLDDEITELSGKTNDIIADVDELSGTTSEIGSNLDELSGKVETIQEDIEESMEDLDAALKLLFENDEVFSGVIETLGTEIVELSGKTDDIIADVDELSGTTSEIGSNLDELSGKVETIQEDIEESMEDLQEAINGINEDVEVLSGKIEQEIIDRQTETHNVWTACTAHTAILEEKDAELEGKINDLTDALDKEIIDRKDGDKSLRETIEAYDARIADNTELIGKVNARELNHYNELTSAVTDSLDTSKKYTDGKVDDLSNSIKIVSDTDLRYYLQVNGEKHGAYIDIPRDQFLKSVEYNNENKSLYFVFVTNEGEKESVVPIGDLVDTYTAGDAIEVKDNIISVMTDKSNFLTLNENNQLDASFTCFKSISEPWTYVIKDKFGNGDESHVISFTSEVSTLKEDIASDYATKDDVENAKQAVIGTTSDSQNEDTINGVRNALSAKAQELEDGIGNTLTQLQTTSGNLMNEIESAEARTKEFAQEEDAKTLSAASKDTQIQISNFKDELDGTLSKLSSDIGEVNALATHVSGVVHTLVDGMDEGTSIKDYVEKAIGDLDARINANFEAIDALQKLYNQLDARVTALETKQ